MNSAPFTKTHLESLSTNDLLLLADDHGVDIPEGLNRRLIIGELLEIAEENERFSQHASYLADAAMPEPDENLPETYNETRVTVLIRDPGWIFVYWDFHTSQFNAITNLESFETFFLRVNTFSREDPTKLIDFFDVDVGVNDRKWYIHLADCRNICRVDLYARNTHEKDRLLAASVLKGIRPGNSIGIKGQARRRCPPLLELSGLSELRNTHFRNHRQSFV